MCNIVVFGESNSGKSTLIGYLISQYKSNFDIERFGKDMEKRLATNFNPSQLYSYIANNTRDELNDPRVATNDLHPNKIHLPFGRVTIIDTPGKERFRGPRERGMYMGNLGLFCVEMQKVLDEDFHDDVISPLLLWSKFKNTRLIILLTKFDLCNKYNKQDYFRAKEKIMNICYNEIDLDLTILPIAIKVKERKDYNVITLPPDPLTDNMWTLLNAIEKESKYLDKCEEEEPLLFCIDKEFNQSRNKSGKVWRIKIISGILKVGDEVILSPVVDNNMNFLTIKSVIKSIRSDISRHEDVTSIKHAKKGDIVGIDLKDCYENSHKYMKNDFNKIFSTCGFSADSGYDTSDSFSFSVNVAGEFEEKRQFSLLWFGRQMSFSVIKTENLISSDSSEIKVTAKLTARKLTLPLTSARNYVFNSLLIRSGEKPDRIYEAKLLQIGEGAHCV